MPIGHIGEVLARGTAEMEITIKYTEGAMRCPHLEKWVVAVCKAKDDLYIPSNFQLHEYCRTKDHRKCPFLSHIKTPKKERELVTR